MAAQNHTEPVNGGLVTSRDPSTLAEGELALCTNAVYKPNSISLHRAPGHSLFGTVSASADIRGLVDCKFDNGNHYLIAETSAGIRYRAPVGNTGAWTSAESGLTTGNWLDSIQYSNKYVLLNGANPNRVIYLAATAVSTTPSFRPHGLAPVTSSPALSTAAGTASVSSVGFYQYWTTEVVKVAKDAANYFSGTASASASAIGQTVFTGIPPAGFAIGDRVSAPTVIDRNSTIITTAVGTFTLDRGAIGTGVVTATWERGTQEVIESTFGSDPYAIGFLPTTPGIVNIATTAIAVTVSRPTPASGFAFNSAATHWRVYRSARLDSVADNKFPSGFLISNDIPINTDAWTDQGVQAAVTRNPGAVLAAGVWNTAVIANVTSSNNVYASATGNGTFAQYPLDIGQWGYTTIADPVRGIEILIEASFSGTVPALLGVQISVDGGASWSNPKWISVANSDTNYTYGGSFDTWGLGMAASQINSNNFQVRCLAGIRYAATTMKIDRIQASVYANAAPGSTADVFPAIIMEVGGETVAIGSHGQPPIASTGDIFEDCLVLNDATQPSHLRWSLAGQVEYFPWVYFTDFETKDNDQITNVKTLGNRLVVGLRNSLWRMNYLPNEDDAKFNRGKALDLISADKGIVHPKAADYFTNGEGRTELAFVSPTGIYATDGFTIRELAPDIDWLTLFSPLSIFNAGTIELTNDPGKWELKLLITHTSVGGTALYRLHYHPTHLKQGGTLKVSGPQLLSHDQAFTDVRATCVVPRTTGLFSTYYAYKGTGTGGGSVYRENAFNIPVTNDGTFDAAVQTRTMYLAGFGDEWNLDAVYTHHQSPDSSALLHLSVNRALTGEADSEAIAAQTFSPAFQGMTKLDTNALGEGLNLHLTDNSGSPSAIRAWTLDFFVCRGANFGEEETP